MNKFMRALGFFFLTLLLVWVQWSLLVSAGVQENLITLMIVIYIGSTICAFVIGSVR